MQSIRTVLIWAGLAAAIAVPAAIATASPFLASRDPVYIAASFAGILALGLLLVQPLLAGGYLPGLAALSGRRVHRWIGLVLTVLVVAHVAGFWLTNAPDVMDALLFESPTPFSVWGVVAMWATFAAALLAALRRWLRIRPRIWRLAHTALALLIVIGTVVHALLIEGSMEQVSKAALCVLVVAATAKLLADLRPWNVLMRRNDQLDRP